MTWKLNTSFLKHETYHTRINESIKDEYIKHALPVYALEYLDSAPIKDIQLTIDHDLFIEVLLLRIRGESIKYSAYKKKEKSQTERELKADIEKLEM